MLLSPFLGVITGLFNKSLTLRAKKWILISFMAFFASVLTTPGPAADANSHLRNVQEHYMDVSFVEFIQGAKATFTFEVLPTYQDLYPHVLAYLTASVLGEPWLFVIFAAIIYAYFYAGSIFRLMQLMPKYRSTWLILGFISLFVIMKFIHDFQTIRSWTGMWVLFYATLSYYHTKKKKYLILAFAPPFIHFSYFIMAIPAWLVLLIRSRPTTFAIIYALSFFTLIIPKGPALSFIASTPLGENKIQGYLLEEEQLKENEGVTVTRNRFYDILVNDFNFHRKGMHIAAFTLIFLGAYFSRMNFMEQSLFSTGILTIALSNTFYFLFALHNRSFFVGAVFILSALVLLLGRGYLQSSQFANNMGMEKLGLWLSLLFLSPFVLWQMAVFIKFTSVFLIAFPFIGWLIPETNFSIREFLLHLI
jgi:hypothetical protein